VRYNRNAINQPRPGAVVTLEILQVPDCPGADLLAARLDTLLAGHRGFQVIRRIVTSQADAERLGMTGSPTLLADGADPFRPSGQPLSLSCRLYPYGQDRPGPAPTLAQLRAALGLWTGFAAVSRYLRACSLRWSRVLRTTSVGSQLSHLMPFGLPGNADPSQVTVARDLHTNEPVKGVLVDTAIAVAHSGTVDIRWDNQG
jgi:hypothetical protein